ncbi:MAG: plasmid pRiA4b ORF-3 family protein [Chloroflexales bacterium]|nr:plasmid pRiA4b ORF-3 family protein [Chloroflexales bacterium]
MPRGKQSRGQCAFCAYETVKGSIGKHLAACPRRQERIAAAEQTKRQAETLYHLRIQSADSSDFWLDLEVRGSAILRHIDEYLRAIWLECCGHLSQFSIGGWSGEEIAKSRRVNQSFQRDVELTHIYDFGMSSETQIKVVDRREGVPLTARPITLMARNLMPAETCIECGQPAKWLCMECLIERNVWGALCDGHAKSHLHEDYGEPIELVNSPRVGMCGYDGPAEPPY